MLETQQIQQFQELFKQSQKLVLINHIQMDPDAYGSLGAFYLVAKALGKEMIVINDELPPEDFAFLGINNIFQTSIDIEEFDPDMILSFDAASEGRLGEIYVKNRDYIQGKNFVVFDHHSTNPGFGNLNFVYPESPSTCEIIFELFEKMGLEKYISKEVATLLTAGIHTDTNVFYNQNTRPETLEIAAKLMRYGADFRGSIYNFFQSFSMEKLKLYSTVGNKIVAYKNKKVFGSIVNQKDFDSIGATKDDTSGIINRLSNLKGAEIVFIIYEYENETKVSMRSKGYDVGKICASFPGGGGHKNAAGFTSDLATEKIIEKILEQIEL
ncbi:bifunctional oligoribonuclease/PAP phosphatase NrnA [Candidatus Gracilibacteria bacterium]|nr:bifunctional oligoribonuclease/PAP phosphatase NrnA [Candidatus Gracilibacteria bacterium]